MTAPTPEGSEGVRYPQGDPECEHPGEYLRMGDHPDVTGRWVSEDIKPDWLYCLRCEQEIEDWSEDGGS